MSENLGLQLQKYEYTLECVGSFPHTLPCTPESAHVTPELHSWPTPFHACTLVVNPKLKS